MILEEMDESTDLLDDAGSPDRSTKEMNYTPNFESIFPQSVGLNNSNGGNSNNINRISSTAPTINNHNKDTRRFSSYQPPPQQILEPHYNGEQTQATLVTNNLPMSTMNSLPQSTIAQPNAHESYSSQLISSTSSPRPQLYQQHQRIPVTYQPIPNQRPQQHQHQQQLQPQPQQQHQLQPQQQQLQPQQQQSPSLSLANYVGNCCMDNEIYVSPHSSEIISNHVPNQPYVPSTTQQYNGSAQANRSQVIPPSQPPMAHSHQRRFNPSPQLSQQNMMSQTAPIPPYNQCSQPNSCLANMLNNVNTLVPNDRLTNQLNQSASVTPPIRIYGPTNTYVQTPGIYLSPHSQATHFQTQQQATQPLILRCQSRPRQSNGARARSRPPVSTPVQTPILDSTTSGPQPSRNYSQNSSSTQVNNQQQAPTNPQSTIPSQPSLPKTSDVEIQANPEYLNKACQFEGPLRSFVNRSLNATVTMVDNSCQTDGDYQESKNQKVFVDRASSPIQQTPQIRRKFTPKRARLVETKNVQSVSGSEEEIDVME